MITISTTGVLFILLVSVLLFLQLIFLLLVRGKLTQVRWGLLALFSALFTSASCHLILQMTVNTFLTKWTFHLYLLISPFILGLLLYISIWAAFPKNEKTPLFSFIPLSLSLIVGLTRSVLATEKDLLIVSNHVEIVSCPLEIISVIFSSISGFVAFFLFFFAAFKSHGAEHIQNKWLCIGYAIATLTHLASFFITTESYSHSLIVHYLGPIIIAITFLISDYRSSFLNVDDIRYRAIFDSIALPILFVSEEDQSFTFNSSFECLLASWPGKPPSLTALFNEIKKVFSGNLPLEPSMEILDVDPPAPSESRRIFLVVNPLLRIKEYSFLLFDLSIEKEKSQQQQDLIRTLAHDLRSPLMALDGATQLILKDLEESSLLLRQKFSLIQRSASTIADLITYFLSISQRQKIPTLQLDLFNPAEESLRISKMYLILFNSKSQPFIVSNQLKDCKCIIEASLTNFFRIITNLLTNAHYHTPSQTKIELGGKIQDNRFILWIKDWGPGVAPSLVLHLFDRKSQQLDDVNLGKTFGIGLYSVSLLIKGNRCKVWYEPNPEGGAIFNVSFPLYSKEFSN